MIPSLLHLSTLWLAGFLLVTLLWPGRSNKDLLLKLILGVGLGPGIDACLYFLVMVASGPEIFVLRWIELIWVLGLGGLVIYRFFPLRSGRIELPPRPETQGWILTGVFVVLLCAVLSAFFFYSEVHPSGTFDAYAIWNLKARLFYRDPQHWTAAFNSDFDWKTHPDYPLLIPLNILRLWQQLGNESARAPAALSAGYTFAIVGLIFAFLRRQRSLIQASLGGILMLATPALLFMGTAQTADMPLAFYILATSILLYLCVQEGQPAFFILAGMTAGLCVWTKNDGLIFILAAALLCAAVWFKQPRRLAWFAIGLILPLGTTLIFKLFYAPPGDMIAGLSLSSIVSKLLEFDRYTAVLASLWKNFWVIGSFQLPVLILVSLAALILQRKLNPADLHAKCFLWLLSGLTVIGYCAVYLITPHPLEWHLKHSMNRLIMQVYPLILMLLILVDRSPKSSHPSVTYANAREAVNRG